MCIVAIEQVESTGLVAVLTLTLMHNQVRGHRTGFSHSGVGEYPREKTEAKVVHLCITAEASHTSAKTYKNEIGKVSVRTVLP